jgi:hypothetical protein
MIYLLIPLLLYCLSGIADAVKDKINHHYSKSIFSKYDEQYWNPRISWKNKYVDNDPKNGFKKIKIFRHFKITKHVAFTDAWHLFKSIKEVLIGIAITFGVYLCINLSLLYSLIFLLVLGILRNFCFTLFYHKLLNK